MRMQTKTQRILGIDPGTARLGYAFVDYCGLNTQLIVDCGIIQTHKDRSDAERLQEIRSDLQNLIRRYAPQIIAVEKIFFFKNPKTIIPVAQARGVILELAASEGLKIFEYTPLEMKKVVTGDGVAKKDFVSKIIHQEFKLENEIKPDDAVDAVGIALCCIRNDLPKLLSSELLPLAQN